MVEEVEEEEEEEERRRRRRRTDFDLKSNNPNRTGGEKRTHGAKQNLKTLFFPR